MVLVGMDTSTSTREKQTKMKEDEGRYLKSQPVDEFDEVDEKETPDDLVPRITTDDNHEVEEERKKGILKHSRTYSNKHVDFNLKVEYVPFDPSKDFCVEIQIVEKMPKKIVSYAALIAEERAKEEAERLAKEEAERCANEEAENLDMGKDKNKKKRRIKSKKTHETEGCSSGEEDKDFDYSDYSNDEDSFMADNNKSETGNVIQNLKVPENLGFAKEGSESNTASDEEYLEVHSCSPKCLKSDESQEEVGIIPGETGAEENKRRVTSSDSDNSLLESVIHVSNLKTNVNVPNLLKKTVPSIILESEDAGIEYFEQDSLSEGVNAINLEEKLIKEEEKHEGPDENEINISQDEQGIEYTTDIKLNASKVILENDDKPIGVSWCECMKIIPEICISQDENEENQNDSDKEFVIDHENLTNDSLSEEQCPEERNLSLSSYDNSLFDSTSDILDDEIFFADQPIEKDINKERIDINQDLEECEMNDATQTSMESMSNDDVADCEGEAGLLDRYGTDDNPQSPPYISTSNENIISLEHNKEENKTADLFESGTEEINDVNEIGNRKKIENPNELS